MARKKLPPRLLDSIRWHLAHNSRFDMLALGVAGWMRYVGGVDEQGQPIEISDPQKRGAGAGCPTQRTRRGAC
ncbi:hypothetical protein DZJ_43030 [Dickeya ananatis]